MTPFDALVFAFAALVFCSALVLLMVGVVAIRFYVMDRRTRSDKLSDGDWYCFEQPAWSSRFERESWMPPVDKDAS